MSAPDVPGPPVVAHPGRGLALRLLLAGLIVLLLTGTAVATVIEETGRGLTAPLQPISGAPPALDRPQPGKPQTILLTGLDHRYADGAKAKSRSDTMILVRLDPSAKATTILALPRDLQVVIPGHGTAPQKLNNAWFYDGARLLTKTIRTTLLGSQNDPFRINDVVSIKFDAFAQAVNHFGCLYSDIDRRYFVAPHSGHAQIDQPAGYQLLCGQAALAYVRFRVQDSDLLREARQANYLTEARSQIDPTSVLTGSGGLVNAVGKYVETNVTSAKQLLGIAKLAVNLSGKPTQRITLAVSDAPDGSGNVVTTPSALTAAREAFLHPSDPTAKRTTRRVRRAARHRRRRRARRHQLHHAVGLPGGMVSDATAGRSAAHGVAPHAGSLPVYYSSARVGGGAYLDAMSHGYRILDKHRRPRWDAYRLVVGTGENGQYYGIQGTAWRDPPIRALSDDSIRLAGRTWKVQYDGRQIRRLVWSAPSGTYWISNTLTDDLSPREMYALARTFTRASGR